MERYLNLYDLGLLVLYKPVGVLVGQDVWLGSAVWVDYRKEKQSIMYLQSHDEVKKPNNGDN